MTIREVTIPNDADMVESLLMADPIEFLPLISLLKGNCFPQAFAGISEGSIETFVTIRKNHRMTVWPGNARYTKPILARWGSQRGALTVGVRHLHEALKVYRAVKAFDEIFTMFVDEKHFVFNPEHKAERLSSDELPKPWTKDFRGIAYGMRVNDKVVSCGTVSGLVRGIGASGAAMGTELEYQKRGYATSTLSYAVGDALKEVPIVTYPVESDNTPAIRVLEKLGFRFYSSFLYTEVEKK